MSDSTAEAMEQDDQETTAAVTVIEPEQSADQMDAVITISKRIEEFAKAMDTITGAIIKRSYPGDWVVHFKPGDTQENQKANMGAAAAERMAAFLGIKETNWSKGIKERSEDAPQHYTYTYEADFTFGKRTIHVISRIGTRDKFFGKKDGEWKPLEEVQEDDIKKAAFRACRKEGVRTLLGLRNVPLSKLKELGFDLEKVNMVGYSAKMSDADKKATASDGLIYKEIKIATIVKKSESKDPKKPWTLWTVSDGKLSYSMFASPDSERLNKLELHMEDQTPVKVGVKVGTYNNQEQYSIERVEGVDEKKAA